MFKKFTAKFLRPIKNIQNPHFRKFKLKLIQSLKNKRFSTFLPFLLKSKVETEFLDYIFDKISYPETILELGSRDALQSIEFSKVFPQAKIYAFECNPPSIKNCQRNIKNYKSIEIIPKAVFNKDTIIKFYPVITENIGASSLFRASGKYDNIAKYPQKEINVEATRIDSWAQEKGIKKIDLAWLDLQGAEYEALEGMGDLLFTIQALFLEVMHQEMYTGQKLFKDILNLITEKGFKMVKYHSSVDKWWGNAIFINKNLKK